MEKYPHTGNLALIMSMRGGRKRKEILLGFKAPKNAEDKERRRKRIGAGLWGMPGGGTELTDRSQKYSVQREVRQETGLQIPLTGFKKVGVLRSSVRSTGRRLWMVHIYMAFVAEDAHLVPNDEYQKMEWFGINHLPQKMFRNDKKWLPRILQGEKVSVDLLFKDETLQSMLPCVIRHIPSFN